jgi:hypothetical protein
MAVKVMVAPAIAKAAPKAERALEAADKKKPKHRRSAVFDADGNEVFITLMCLKCHKMRPLSQFGLRKMADGAIRNQPWCRSCRSGTGDKPSKDKVEVEPSVEPMAPEAQNKAAPEKSSPTRFVAAEVAAALAAGWKR